MDGNRTAPGIEPARHWINGERVRAAAVARSVNPSTGEVLGHYSAGGRIEAAAAIAAARRGFDLSVWPHDPEFRSRALRELADRLDERAEAIALMLSREMGKTLRDATFEATVSPSTLRYNAGTALSQTGTSSEIAPGVYRDLHARADWRRGNHRPVEFPLSRCWSAPWDRRWRPAAPR